MTLSTQDTLELHELAGRYGDIIDDRDWAALATVFTEDAVFEVRELVTMNGLAQIRHFMENEGRHPLAHLITNIHVAVGDAGVQMRSRGIFPIAKTDDGAGHRVFYGSYYDEVAKTADGWRIRQRVFSTARL